MVKKQAYFKNLRRSIFKSKARFLSIFAIVLLGAAFFAGLRNTPLIMKETMDAYLDKYHHADLTYLSSLGLSMEDINSLKDIEGIDQISYGYQFDALMSYKDKNLGITVYTNENYTDDMVNRPDLIKGHYPTLDNECLIDEVLNVEKDVQLNDIIRIHNDQGEKDYKVVGIINDTRYISSMDRGTNTLGDGTNSGFIQVLTKGNENLALPAKLYDLRDEKILYNQLSVTIKGAQDYNVFSEDYDDFIEDANTKIKSTLSLRMSCLYEDISGDASDELEKAQKDYDKGLKSYENSKGLFDQKILEAKIQLTQAKMTLAKKEEEYLKVTKQATQQLDKIPQEIEKLQKQLDDLNKQLQQETPPDITLPDMPEKLPEISIKDELSKSLDTISKSLSQTTRSIEGLLQLSDASLQIQQAKLEIQKNENKLTLEELKTNKQLTDAKLELDDASIKLKEAKDEINQIPKGKIYTLTRHENASLVNYQENTNSISAIANVFPLMFFLVSALVSLTTMTRMVEEQRGQSGILRALGYSKWDVMKQYVIYVILATFFACIIGIMVGTEFFPRIIYYLYNLMLFEVNAPIVIVSDVMIVVQTIFISVFVTLFVTLVVCIGELNLMPSILMRPKAPKIGKRIFLERIPFIWKRLSFNRKVTMRNIFRYKKRFFMSVIGIAGCTALIITGFGIKDSVAQVVDLQYKTVLRYDAAMHLEDPVLTKDAQVNTKKLLQRNEISNVEYVYNQTIHILKNKEDLIGSLVVYQSMDNISNFISFSDYQNEKKIALDDEGIVLSQKTAELLDAEVNDTIDIELNDQKYNVKVSAIMKNYFMNYVYMSQNYYESLLNEDLKVNQAFMNLTNDSLSNQKTLEDYVKSQHFGNITYIDDIGSDFYSQVQSVDMVVVILIVCAGLLNFIVLYNLTNINIQERKSEIATIKVLGFRKKEVYDYVFRENIMLSIIGSIVGMGLGFVLHQFIIRTVELDMTMFVRNLSPYSYMIAVIITIAFTMFINLTMRHVLNKVDMVESLKSIE